MNDPDRATVQRLGEVLLAASPLHERFFALRHLGPAAGSRSITDLDVPMGELVRSGAVAAVNSSLDHLVAWAALCLDAGQLPAFAHLTLLRSTVESASTARWLVDPRADPRVRVERGIGHLIADLGERHKLERIPHPSGAPALPKPSSEYRTAAQRITELEAQAAAAGLAPQRASHTDLGIRHGLGEFAYRMLCAFAHGGQAIPFAASSKGQPDQRDAGGLRAVAMTGDVGIAIRMTEGAIALARQAVREVFEYHGHEFEPTSADAV